MFLGIHATSGKRWKDSLDLKMDRSGGTGVFRYLKARVRRKVISS